MNWRKLVMLSVLTMFFSLIIGIRITRPLGTNSAISGGPGDVVLGPFVGEMDHDQFVANNCHSNSWTRSCFQSAADAKSAKSESQTAFSTAPCFGPTDVIGNVGKKSRIIHIVERGILVAINELYPNFEASEIHSGSCGIAIYDYKDQAEPEIIRTLLPHQNLKLGKSLTEFAIFQK